MTNPQSKKLELALEALALIEERDLVQRVAEEIELERSGPYAHALSSYIESQLIDLERIKNILIELKKL